MHSDRQGTKAHCLDTAPMSMLTVPAGEWDPEGPTESSSQHHSGGRQKSEWQLWQTLFNVGHVGKLSVWKQDTEVACGFCLRKSYTGWKASALPRDDWGQNCQSSMQVNSLVKINSAWPLTIFHNIWTTRNTGKLDSKFEQEKAFYFYIWEAYITEPVAMVCLDASKLRQALNAIK